MTEGLRWARGVLNHVLLLLALLLLTVGITVGGVLLHRPAWFLGVFGGVLLIVVLGEGAYRVWREAEGRVTDGEQHAEAKDESVSEPVSDAHRKELQAIAVHLLEGVKHTGPAYYLPPGTEKVNLAWAFNEHFSEIEKEVIRWNALIETLAGAEGALRDWIENQLSEAGIGGGPTAHFIAREAQSAEPHFEMDKAAGEIRIGGADKFVFSFVGSENREGKEAALQSIFDRARNQPERARIDLVRLEMRTAQRSLIEALELVRDKAVIRGRCQLCT